MPLCSTGLRSSPPPGKPLRDAPRLCASAFSLATLLLAASLSATPRVWTDIEGRTVEAELVRADVTSVVIRRAEDGREFTLPRARLSAADLAFLDTPPPPPAWIDGLDQALGLPLLADANLWDDAPATVAARLRLRPESITPGYESWRSYARPATPLLGVPAYMIALRAEEGRVAEFSILFTNRGDYPAFVGLDSHSVVPPADLAAFRAALASDFKTLRSTLGSALPPEAAIEPSAALRRSSPGDLAVFEFGDHQLSLQSLPDQLLALRLRPTDRAAPPRLSDDQLRQRLRSLVTRRENADVVLDRIPMVDQGPKGYCVPATFERLLRYAGIPADMYDLAALGDTGFGGGTNVPRLIEELERTVRQAGRRLEAVELKPSAATLARYIDEGRPVLWALSSTSAFNTLADLYSKERAALPAATLKAWAAERRRLGATLAPQPDTGHLCLLTGYNRVTGELAFSDSWGPAFAERWLPATAIQAVDSGRCWVLNF